MLYFRRNVDSFENFRKCVLSFARHCISVRVYLCAAKKNMNTMGRVCRETNNDKRVDALSIETGCRLFHPFREFHVVRVTRFIYHLAIPCQFPCQIAYCLSLRLQFQIPPYWILSLLLAPRFPFRTSCYDRV